MLLMSASGMGLGRYFRTMARVLTPKLVIRRHSGNTIEIKHGMNLESVRVTVTKCQQTAVSYT